jgi:ribonuclease R
MIAANEAVGRTLESAEAPAIYRVHPPPDPEKMETFSRVAQALGAPPNFKNERPSPAQLGDYLRSLQGLGVQATISHLLLRSLMQARYSPTCDGHYGLASGCYLHFTSPIRRYPDLVVHRQLGALLDKASDLPLSPGSASKVAQVCSQAERRALEAERAALSLYQAAYMLDYLGEVFEGTISFVMDFGLFVRLHPTGIEGMVHISRMRDDYYQYHDDQLALVGRRTGKSFRVGTEVSVRVESVQLSRRQVDLIILEQR